MARIAGVVLCGGAGQRMGGRKALRPLAGKALAAHVADVMKVDAVAVVGDADAAGVLGVENVDDPYGVRRGPLAGVVGAMGWAGAQGAEWVMVAPCDTPLLPADVVARLAAEDADAAYAVTADGPHPLVSLWRTRLAPELRRILEARHPPVHEVLASFGARQVFFADAQAFMNINTPEDLQRAEALLAARR